MGKWIDSEISKHIAKKIDAIELVRKILSEDEIEEVMPKVIKHYKEHIDDADVYSDGSASYVLLKTLPKPDKIPDAVKSKFSDDYTRRLFCKFKNGFFGVFGTDDQWALIGWDASAWCRGKLTEQFDIAGYDRKYYKSLEKAMKSNDLTDEDISESDIIMSYTFNIWQVIE